MTLKISTDGSFNNLSHPQISGFGHFIKAEVKPLILLILNCQQALKPKVFERQYGASCVFNKGKMQSS